MCGIAGIASISSAPLEPMRIKDMCDSIAHRGPDDAGYSFFRLSKTLKREGGYWCEFVDEEFRGINEHLPVLGGQYSRDELSNGEFSLALGHRRLSIIDLTHYGHQPMASPCRRYWVVYNGEIYNFPELKEALEKKGHLFNSRSDTEVLLHLWEEYGVDCLSMLNGMFAIAMYDRMENELVLARDRFGVKPLYYAIHDGFLLFGSEIKAILASRMLPSAIEPSSLVEYFSFQNIFSAKTLFRGVNILAAGQYLVCRPNSGQEPILRNYHSHFPSMDASLTDVDVVAEKIAVSFGNAVKRQLISDVEVGSYLSGGMDSGSIVAVAGKNIPRLMTFTGGFDLTNVNGIEQGFDERGLAEKLSYLLQTEHYDVVLHAGDMPAAMERITWHMDDPRVGMCHQNWYVAKLASRFVKVCLAGAGGDELFAGYPWRYRHGMDAVNAEEFDKSYFKYWHRLFGPDAIRGLFSPDLGNGFASVEESFARLMGNAPDFQKDFSIHENLMQRALYFEFKTFMHGFLVTEDHISMAHSLETRVPFLDNDLADLAWSIPPSMKVNMLEMMNCDKGGHVESAEGKMILRRAMEEYLPAEFTRQHKQGFSPPDENWFRGPSMDYIKSILLDKQTLDRAWFDRGFVTARLDEHFNGRQNHRLLIWSLLSFEWLQRHFVE